MLPSPARMRRSTGEGARCQARASHQRRGRHAARQDRAFRVAPPLDHIQIEGEHDFGKPGECAYLHAIDALGVAARIVDYNLEWEVVTPRRLGDEPSPILLIRRVSHDDVCDWARRVHHSSL